MIVDIIYFLGGTLISMLCAVLNFLIPYQVSSALYGFISYFETQLSYFGGVIDLQSLFFCISAIITFFYFWYMFKLVRYFFRIFIGLFSIGAPQDFDAS